MSTRRLRKSIIVGRVVSVEEMQDDHTSRPQLTYPIWINRLCQWWRKRINQDPLEPEDRATLKRDLQPLIDIYNQL